MEVTTQIEGHTPSCAFGDGAAWRCRACCAISDTRSSVASTEYSANRSRTGAVHGVTERDLPIAGASPRPTQYRPVAATRSATRAWRNSSIILRS